MDSESLTTIVALLVALSVATERLVEIVQGACGWFREKENATDKQKARRKARVEALAVFSGIATTAIAWPVVGGMLPGSWGKNTLVMIAMGLLASGGSGFWASVQAYILAVKNIKQLDVDERKRRNRSDASASEGGQGSPSALPSETA